MRVRMSMSMSMSMSSSAKKTKKKKKTKISKVSQKNHPSKPELQEVENPGPFAV
jgi:hypothetical protein